MYIRSILQVVLAGFVLWQLTACSSKEPDPTSSQVDAITIAVTPWPASAAIFVAAEKGYFKEEGLSVTLQTQTSGHLGVAAVLNGKADFATSGVAPVARAAIENQPLAVIATIAQIEDAIRIIARKDKDISTPSDLKGKRIGVVYGTAADFFLHIYLVTSYIDPKEVQRVDLAPDMLVEALLSGSVDAVSTWAPQRIQLTNALGDDALVLGDPNIYRMTWNLSTSRNYIDTHPESIPKLLRAVIKANRFIAEEAPRAHAISTAQMGKQHALFDDEWWYYHFGLTLEQSLILNLEDQARWMLKHDGAGQIKTPNFLNFIYIDALQSVRPEAVRMIGR